MSLGKEYLEEHAYERYNKRRNGISAKCPNQYGEQEVRREFAEKVKSIANKYINNFDDCSDVICKIDDLLQNEVKE